jgi:hypothetical protein
MQAHVPIHVTYFADEGARIAQSYGGESTIEPAGCANCGKVPAGGLLHCGAGAKVAVALLVHFFCLTC